MCSIVQNNIDFSGVEELSHKEEENNNYHSEEEQFFHEDYRDEFGQPVTPLCCDICNIKVTSAKILQRHLDGRKHKMRSERKGKTYYCDLCDVTANSETQLNIHMSSSKHKSKIIKKECSEFTELSANCKALWILIFCLLCIFLNLLLLFRLYL